MVHAIQNTVFINQRFWVWTPNMNAWDIVHKIKVAVRIYLALVLFLSFLEGFTIRIKVTH